jgi:hypothetical protein
MHPSIQFRGMSHFPSIAEHIRTTLQLRQLRASVRSVVVRALGSTAIHEESARTYRVTILATTTAGKFLLVEREGTLPGTTFDDAFARFEQLSKPASDAWAVAWRLFDDVAAAG